jgi:photosystem II stability/assembly factor-like uncharacterized protein
VTFLGTMDGVFRLDGDALEPLGLEGRDVSALHAGADGLLAGTYGDGLFRSIDAGRSWEPVTAGLTAATFRFVTGELAGTEPARLFRSPDGGQSWDEYEAITRVPGYEEWYLPYSPRAGAARNALVHGDRLLVSAEVAGLLRSDDGGRTWACDPVAGDRDIHQVAVHPADPDLLYVAGGSGIARSRDGGLTWERIEADYTRATLVPAARPDLLVAGPAPRVGRDGRIVVSADGGDSWDPAGAGIDVPMPDMVERFIDAPDGSVWAICSRGRLLRAEPGEWSWASALPAGADVHVKAVAFA